VSEFIRYRFLSETFVMRTYALSSFGVFGKYDVNVVYRTSMRESVTGGRCITTIIIIEIN